MSATTRRGAPSTVSASRPANAICARNASRSTRRWSWRSASAPLIADSRTNGATRATTPTVAQAGVPPRRNIATDTTTVAMPIDADTSE